MVIVPAIFTRRALTGHEFHIALTFVLERIQTQEYETPQYTNPLGPNPHQPAGVEIGIVLKAHVTILTDNQT
jgi:hypothetical protein